MSNHLVVNGVVLETMAKTGDKNWESLGESTRAVDGSWIGSSVNDKRKWNPQSTHLSRAEADAWTCLLQGRGHVWRMNDQYSVKALGTSATLGTVNFNVAGGKFSAQNDFKMTLAVTSYARWTPTGRNSLIAGGLNSAGTYTLIFWRLETAVWYQYIIVNDNSGVITRYKNGVSIGTGAATFAFVHATGYVQLGDATNAETGFADLVAIPEAIPSTWIASLYANTRQFSTLPLVEITGEMVSAPTTPINARGSVSKENEEPFFDNSGVFQQGGKLLDVVLVEA